MEPFELVILAWVSILSGKVASMHLELYYHFITGWLTNRPVCELTCFPFWCTSDQTILVDVEVFVS